MTELTGTWAGGRRYNWQFEQQPRSPRIIRLLIEYGADPNSWVGDESPLNIASRLWYEGDREIIEMLLDYGADINSRSTVLEGLTPLHRAIIGDAEPRSH